MTVYILNTIKNSFEYLGRWDVVALFSIFLLFTDYLQIIYNLSNHITYIIIKPLQLQCTINNEINAEMTFFGAYIIFFII